VVISTAVPKVVIVLKKARSPLFVSNPGAGRADSHSPLMTAGTYAPVIRDLKGQPVVSAEEQIERARMEDGGRLVDVDAV
jgi:hypothetical protein